MSKYLSFTEAFGDIVVFNKKQNEPLGKITYYPRWRQHVLEPLPGSIFNDECLADIILRIKEQNAVRKNSAVKSLRRKLYGPTEAEMNEVKSDCCGAKMTVYPPFYTGKDNKLSGSWYCLKCGQLCTPIEEKPKKSASK